MTIEEITPLYDDTVRAAWGTRISVPARPSEADIEAAEVALAIRFPASVRYFILHSDFGYPVVVSHDPRHTIVWDNDYYRNNHSWVMPSELVMFAGGHDGDCDCFDTRSADVNGEYAIVYWDLESMTEIDEAVVVASTFPAFLIKRIEWLMTKLR